MTSSVPGSSPAYSSGAAGEKKTKSIVSLVLGGVGVITSFIIPFIGILAGIAGLIVAILARRSEPSGHKLALGGLILSIVAVVLSIVLIILGAIAVASLLDSGTITVPSN